MVYGEGIRQDERNIAETADVVTKGVGRSRPFARNSNRRSLRPLHAPEGATAGNWAQKAPAASSRGRGVRRLLEDDLRCDLQVEWLARAKARRSVEVANGVANVAG